MEKIADIASLIFIILHFILLTGFVLMSCFISLNKKRKVESYMRRIRLHLVLHKITSVEFPDKDVERLAKLLLGIDEKKEKK